MKRNKLIVGIGLLLIAVFALHGFANAQELEQYVLVRKIDLGFSPKKVAVAPDGGIVYVPDDTSGIPNGVVYRFDGDGNPITSPLTGLNHPHGIAVDAAGTVYVTENVPFARSVAKVDPITRLFCTDWRPYHIAHEPGTIGTNVHLWVVDRGNQCIWECSPYSPSTQCAGVSLRSGWTYYQQPGSADGQYNNPEGLAVNSSDPNNVYLYVADSQNCRIQRLKVDNIGNLQFDTKWGSQGSGDFNFMEPSGVALDLDGNVYVVDTGNHCIKKYNSDGTKLQAKWGSHGSGDTQLSGPEGIAVDSNGMVYVADTGNNCIKVISHDPVFLIQNLIGDVLDIHMNQGIENSMESKLENAIAALDAANAQQRQDTINKLEAFKSAVEAQRDKELTGTQADYLIAAADAIIALLQL